MSDLREVSPIGLLTGMTVVSLSSGNRLGTIVEPFIDPINGVLLGVSIASPDGSTASLTHDQIYSFGRDAVMATSDSSVASIDEGALGTGRPAGDLIGTKIITESGDILGQITNLFVTLQPAPRIIYEARQSIIDTLLGRTFFVPASLGHALSDDGERLIVPDITTDIVSSDLRELAQNEIEVRSFDPVASREGTGDDDGDTEVVIEEETLIHLQDDEDTVLRRPRNA